MNTMSAAWKQFQQHENGERWLSPRSATPQHIASSSRFPENVSHYNHLILSAPLPTANYKHLWIRWEHTKEKHSATRSFCSAAPTLWNKLPDTLYKTQIISCFRRQLKSQLFPAAYSRSPASLSSSLSPFLYHLHQVQRACGCLHGVKLSYTSGHRRWLWHENTQTVKSKSTYFNETITQNMPTFLGQILSSGKQLVDLRTIKEMN